MIQPNTSPVPFAVFLSRFRDAKQPPDRGRAHAERARRAVTEALERKDMPDSMRHALVEAIPPDLKERAERIAAAQSAQKKPEPDGTEGKR